MQPITINGIGAKQWSDWNELPLGRLLLLAPVLLGGSMELLREVANGKKREELAEIIKGNELYMEVCMRLLWMVTDMRWKFRFQREMFALRPEHYARIIGSDENPVEFLFNSQLTEQRLPRVRVGLRYYHGPRAYMGGITLGEHLFAQARYTNWLRVRTKRALAAFFGALYRPMRSDVAKDSADFLTDCRAELLDSVSDARSKRFMRLDEGTMLVAVLYWQGCHARLRRDYPFAFDGGTGKGDGHAGELILSVAKDRNMTDEQASGRLLHSVLMEMNKVNRDAARR